MVGALALELEELRLGMMAGDWLLILEVSLDIVRKVPLHLLKRAQATLLLTAMLRKERRNRATIGLGRRIGKVDGLIDKENTAQRLL